MKKTIAIVIFIVLGIFLIGCTAPIAEIIIDAPSDQSSIECDTSQGSDFCYISVSGTAKIPDEEHICLYLKFSTAEEWWVGGGGAIDKVASSGQWTMTRVGVGDLEVDNPPPLLIAALITKETCQPGSTMEKLPSSSVEYTIQVQR